MKKCYMQLLGIVFTLLFSVSLALPMLAVKEQPAAESDCREVHDLEVIQSNGGAETASPDNLVCTLTGHDYYDWMRELISTSDPTENECFVKYWHVYKRCSRCGYAPEDPEPDFTMQLHEWEISYAFKTCIHCGYQTERGPFDGFSIEP